VSCLELAGCGGFLVGRLHHRPADVMVEIGVVQLDDPLDILSCCPEYHIRILRIPFDTLKTVHFERLTSDATCC
jgi:hypothetical protein